MAVTYETKRVWVGGTPCDVLVEHNDQDDNVISGFMNGRARERALGIRIADKRGRKNMNGHRGWRAVEDLRAHAEGLVA